MKDKRAYEIKRILYQHFPNAIFKVKIHKYSLGESIHIKTDLIKPWDEKDSHNNWLLGSHQINIITPEIKATQEKMEKNEKVRSKIEALLKDFENIYRDPSTGEILGGGNTYLFVEELD